MRTSVRMKPVHTFVAVTAAFVTLISVAIQGQTRPPAGQQAVPSDLEIQQAATAIEQADGYVDVLAATQKYAAIISSPRVVELVDAALQNAALNDAQRGVLLLERQLSIDCRTLGAAPAARLLAVRVIAGSAIQADTPQQFAAVLEKFSPLAGVMTVDLVRQALNTPGNTWPKPLLPLMEQLARDWPTLGALGAATKMAAAANANPNPDPGTEAASERHADARGTLAQHDDLVRQPARRAFRDERRRHRRNVDRHRVRPHACDPRTLEHERDDLERCVGRRTSMGPAVYVLRGPAGISERAESTSVLGSDEIATSPSRCTWPART